MSKTRVYVLGAIAAGLLLVLTGSMIWILKTEPSAHSSEIPKYNATNLALDVRFTYDPAVFIPAPYDQSADYPLQLDATTFSFYGKRIRGLGAILVKEPGAMLFDFVGVSHMSIYEEEYGLRLVGEPAYQDATLGGALGLEMEYQFRRGPYGKWPSYLPSYLKVDDEQAMINVIGWAVFSTSDLFIFEAISDEPLDEMQRQACLNLINSVEYDALLGEDAGDVLSSPNTKEEPEPEELAAE